MNQEEIFELVAQVLRQTLDVAREEVTPETTLVGGLGASGTDFLDIEKDLEKVLKVQISSQEILKFVIFGIPPHKSLTVVWDTLFDMDHRLNEVGQETMRHYRTDLVDRDWVGITWDALREELYTVDRLVKYAQLKLSQ